MCTLKIWELIVVDRNVNELSVVEVKALLFDLDQELKFKQSQYESVIKILQTKLVEEQNKKIEDKKEVVEKKE